ncbi:hypothetical protein LPJ54_005442, partial [Coemansia sp. RSA 1824]
LQVRMLQYPEVALHFTLGSTYFPVFLYSATQSLNQRVSQIYGPSMAQMLDFVSITHGKHSLYGSVSRAPVQCQIQHIFLNGRVYDTSDALGTVRLALTTDSYMSKSNVAIQGGASVNSSRTMYPMFILIVTVDDTAASAQESVTDEEVCVRLHHL